MKLVSVVIATYNEEKYIRQCIASLLQQDYPKFEIIVVDDGSNDGTEGLLKKMSVTYLKRTHEGTARARNYAVSQAKGEIIVFLDADMEFEPNFLTKLVEPINKGITKGTYSKLEYVKNWEKALARCWNRNNNPPLPDKLRIPQDKEEGEDFRAILKSEFERVNGFDNTGYTDTWTLAHKLDYRPVNAPDAVYYHHNPQTLDEIFHAAQWKAKRSYKFGVIGAIIALFRAFIGFSLIKGVYRSLVYKEGVFVPFQIIYDLGTSVGIVQYLLFGKVIK